MDAAYVEHSDYDRQDDQQIDGAHESVQDAPMAIQLLAEIPEPIQLEI